MDELPDIVRLPDPDQASTFHTLTPENYPVCYRPDDPPQTDSQDRVVVRLTPERAAPA